MARALMALFNWLCSRHTAQRGPSTHLDGGHPQPAPTFFYSRLAA